MVTFTRLVCEKHAIIVRELRSGSRRREIVKANGVPQFLFKGFTGTMKLSDFPQPFIAVVLLRFRARTSRCHPTRPVRGISRFSCIECPRMLRVSDSAGPMGDSLSNAAHCVAFPAVRRGRHPGEVISELNGWPALPPVNASRATSRLPAHDSGP